MENLTQQNQETAEKSKKNNLVTREIAISEVQQFIEKFEDSKKQDFEVEKDYPQMLQAIQQGYLTFDEELKPSLRLKYPVKNTDGEIAVENISFRTRIKPTQLRDIMKGLNISQNQVEYTLRCVAYLTGQPIAMLDKFEKFDYRVIEQVATVFI